MATPACLFVRSGKTKKFTILKAGSHAEAILKIAERTDSRKIAEFLSRDGQLLLPYF